MEEASKTIIVTGSNRGIGYAIIEILLQRQQQNIYPKNRIIMTGRDKNKGEESLKVLQSKYPNFEIFFELLDVSDTKSINEFYERFKQKFQSLDILINNAGYLGAGDAERQEYQNEEQIDQHININFFGVVSLTEKLLPLLNSNGKIVTVSTQGGQLAVQNEDGRKILSDPNLTTEKLFEIAKDYKTTCLNKTMKNWSFSTYCFSKALVNTYHRFVLTKKLKNDQLSFTGCPGHCDTEMGKIGGKDRKVQPSLTPYQGATHILYLAYDIPFKKNDWNGSFFAYNCKEPSNF